MNPDQFERWVAKFKHGHEGIENAYKTLFLSAGADVKVVGTNLKDLDLKAIQGAGETRICCRCSCPGDHRGCQRRPRVGDVLELPAGPPRVR